MRRIQGNKDTKIQTNRRYRLLLFPCFLVSFLFLPLFAHAYALYRDLSLGDTGDDVKALQEILNSRPETAVAVAGAGSFGQETTYFGEKTRAAVIKYQELFASSILIPLGISAGTGYVGTATRAALALGAVNNDEPAAVPEEAETDEDNFKGTPTITALERIFVENGVTITLTGSGFTKTGNKVHTNHGIFTIASTNGTSLSFTIEAANTSPESGGVDSGLFVKNKNGTSGFIFFTVGL